jgi:hypothetical protein
MDIMDTIKSRDHIHLKSSTVKLLFKSIYLMKAI